MKGRELRLARIMNQARRRTVIVPMDHGFSLGQVSGLKDMKGAIERVIAGGADAIVLHRGMVRHFPDAAARSTGLIVHLSGGTTQSHDPEEKVPVCTVREAVGLGADAVSIQVNLGSKTESRMIEAAGMVSRECSLYGMPLLIMCYPKGKRQEGTMEHAIGHCIRVAEELGADLIKTAYTGSPASFAPLVEACSVPIVVAGGERSDEGEILAMVRGAISAGAAGVCMGRNTFQRNDTAGFIGKIRRIVYETSEEQTGNSLVPPLPA
ncbi:MAG: 2-amino-3,7-dideoxy-D-threo-hept-6-ulosonate synthase [Methanomicrobiales archaeon]|nr:2-amino-3,7-dideoxy-D-threo-hept-6-ulosonate synthase [Methanomicrobiales archaeon]